MTLDELYNAPEFRLEPSNSQTDNFKFYENPALGVGYYIPRVTKLLDTIKEDYLLQWANSLGWKRKSYSRTLQDYAELGSQVHCEIEMYLKEGEIGVSPGFKSFLNWWMRLNQDNIITDVQSEVELICPYFGGTTDLFFKVNGKNCLVDFKTSKHISYKYIAQLAAYRHMMEERLGEPIDICIILQLDKYEVVPAIVYTYDMSNPVVREMFDHAYEYILILAQGFFYNQYLQNMFNSTSKSVMKEAEGPYEE